jgi:hypothetical protein
MEKAGEGKFISTSEAGHASKTALDGASIRLNLIG